jgi:hypothetical protein
MGWKEFSIMSQRIEFVTLALKEDTNFSELCKRFGISRKTGYKFLYRYIEEGLNGLYDRSRRPRNSPNATDSEVEQLILGLRDTYPPWGDVSSSVGSKIGVIGIYPRRVQSPRFLGVMEEYLMKNLRSIGHGRGLRLRGQTISGRWTLKGIFL